MRRALAEQIRRPFEALAAGGNLLCRRGQLVVVLAAKKVSLSQRKLNPPIASRPSRAKAWQRVTEGMQPAFGSRVGAAVAANTTPEVPMVADTEPGCNIPMPTRPRLDRLRRPPLVFPPSIPSGLPRFH